MESSSDQNLKRKRDSDEESKEDEVQLIKAAEEGVKHVNDLLVKGTNIHAQDCDGETPFIKACMNGHLEVAKLLITNGADMNVKNEFSFLTPLHNASQDGNFELSKFLLENGVIIDATDRYGETT